MTKIWMKSCFRLKNLRVQVFCGLMGALAIVLDQFSVALNPFVKIGFSGLPNRLIDYLFGRCAVRRRDGCGEIYHQAGRNLPACFYLGSYCRFRDLRLLSF